jgi:hypothetical protein
MVHLEEGKLRFSFDTNIWPVVIKADEHPDFKSLEKLNYSKAVDFICASENEVTMIEVKDFRNHGIENKLRLEDGGEHLCTEVGCKVKDSVSGVIGGARNSTHEKADWLTIARSLINDRHSLKLVLWLEENNGQPKRSKAGAGIYTNKLKTKLKWLTGGNHAIVIDNTCNSIPGVTVTFLPN